MESEEQFKPIPGWEGKYSIGNYGTVLSHVWNVNKVLTTKKTKLGYNYVSLSTGKERPNLKSIGIARAVAAAFVPNPNGYNDIIQMDGDKDNCRADNLLWVKHNPNSRKQHGYVYHVKHVDAPNEGFVFYAVNHVVDHTGLSPLSVSNYLLRHPGEPGKTGWIISCEKIKNYGQDRLKP
jgi:hypothetical protein